MKQKEFTQWLAKTAELTPKQRQQVADSLQPADPEPSLPAKVLERQAQLNQSRQCVHCGQSGAIKHGKTAGLIRFRCQAADCSKTFTALTGTHLKGLRHKDKWEAYQACMRDRLTLHESAKRCGINYRTAFKWRHRFLQEAREAEPLCGVVEMDETYFLESAKGSRKLKERRPARQRGGNKGHRGLSAAQRPVLTAVARGGDTRAWASPTAQALPIRITMAAFTTADAVVVSDAHPSYGAACRELGREHEVINGSDGQRVRGAWHLNTVNNRHYVMKSVLNHRHRGVGTKYLDNYTHWLSKQEFRVDKTRQVDFIGDLTTPKQQCNT